MASDFAPTGAFVQAGSVSDTRNVSIGASWDWDTTWALGSGRLSAYNEASLSQWWYQDGDRSQRERTTLLQIALVPVFRYRPSGGDSPWFGEVGIGVSVSTRLYDTSRSRFSTAFNFSDHLAIGRSFGDQREHEIALRVEHYSNGGIKAPNPGITFVSLRYSRQFR